MGYIKEPDGVDFFVDSTPLTEKDRKEISEVIAYYKMTGRKKKISTSSYPNISSISKQKTHQLAK